MPNDNGDDPHLGVPPVFYDKHHSPTPAQPQTIHGLRVLSVYEQCLSLWSLLSCASEFANVTVIMGSRKVNYGRPSNVLAVPH